MKVVKSAYERRALIPILMPIFSAQLVPSVSMKKTSFRFQLELRVLQILVLVTI